jgi:NADH-quinone oxidoreductase subunit H
LTKGILGVTVMMWVRWTLPRLRIDQVITTCLKYCVPIAAVMFLGATWWQYQMPERTFFGLLSMPNSAYELREHWPNAQAKAAPPLDESEDQQAAAASAEETVALMAASQEGGR